MASDESLTMVSSSILDEDYEDTDDGFQYQTRHSSLSRLSVCTSSLHDDEDDDAANNPSSEVVGIFMSGLSLESFDGAEADGEVSDVDRGGGKEDGHGSSDSDKEPGFYSLPATPSRRRKKIPGSGGWEEITENERKKKDGSKCNPRRQRKATREKRPSWMVRERENHEKSNSGVGEEGLMVITRAGVGKRAMRMGLEEVKACRDLGFDLEHEKRLSVEVHSGRASVSAGSTLETQTTSSGGNSPIANWRISSPGDDPREVKARLKVWAQAVALASSASRHAS